MKPQDPAQGILLTRDYGDSIFYKVPCECGDSDHEHNIVVEAEDSYVTVTIYTTEKSKWWSLNRWQKIWTLITKGYVEYEADLIMNEQQALNYSETLKKATQNAKEFREKRKSVSNLGS